MKNLINKITKLAMIPIIAVGLNGCNVRNDKKILKIEKSGYVEFHDSNGKIYEDFGKDGTLDCFYDAKEYSIADVTEIVDALDESRNYLFKQILRNSDEALNLQIEFNKIKKRYEKQGEGK